MKLLLDTHAFLFFINGDKSLPSDCRNLIQDSSNDVCLSRASLWEIAIKNSLGKLELKKGFSDTLLQVKVNSIAVWPIGDDDLVTLNNLPFHHRDPFDRIIIAQVITFNNQHRNITVITRDRNFSMYDIPVIW